MKTGYVHIKNIKSVFDYNKDFFIRDGKPYYKISKYLNENMATFIKNMMYQEKIAEDLYLVCPGYYTKDGLEDIQIGGTGTQKIGENEFEAIKRESLEEMSIDPYFDENTELYQFRMDNKTWSIANFINENFDSGSLMIENNQKDDRNKKVGFLYWVDEEKIVDISEKFSQRIDFSENILNLFFISKNDVERILFGYHQ